MYLVYIWFTCLAEIIHLLNGTIIKGYVWLEWAASDLIEKKNMKGTGNCRYKTSKLKVFT